MNLYYVGVDVSKATVDVAGWHEPATTMTGVASSALRPPRALATKRPSIHFEKLSTIIRKSFPI